MQEYIRKVRKNTKISRTKTKMHYMDLVYNLWMNKYNVDGLDFEQRHWMFQQLWYQGRFAFFKIKNTEDTLNPSGILGVAPFAMNNWNYLYFPSQVSLINVRGVSFIPNTLQTVNEDVVLCYAQPNFKPIVEIVEYNIDKIVNIEMILDTNLNTYKLPWAIACSPEDETRLSKVLDKILNDEDIVYIAADDLQLLKTLVNSNPYIADKLFQMKNERWNEILTFLGINNVESNKKEHLIVNEVDANNQLIQEMGYCIEDYIKECCEKVSEVLGYTLELKPKHEVKQEVVEEPNDMEGGDDNGTI